MSKKVNNLSSDFNMVDRIKIQERPVSNMLVGALKLFIYQEY